MADGDQGQQGGQQGQQNGGQQNNGQQGGQQGGQQQQQAWHTGLDAETIGHIQNRGLKLDDPKAIVDNLAKAHREASAKLGVPSDQLLRMPKPDAPEAEIKAFWQKLGAPADAKEYDFGEIKYADGNPLEEKYAAALRGTFARLNLPKSLAIEIAKDQAKYADADEAEQKTLDAGRLATEKADLARSWGPNEEKNKFIATQARAALQAKLGLPNDKMAEAVGALENAYGYSNVMKLFHLVGTSIGEDKFVGGGGGNSGPMSREQAIARKGELMKDTGWQKRYYDGDVKAREEMLLLNRAITGDWESAA